MQATRKMDAFGLKALCERVQAIRPGTAIETLYRWRQALNAGTGVKDHLKTVLIEATSGSEHAIVWADFAPPGAADREPDRAVSA